MLFPEVTKKFTRVFLAKLSVTLPSLYLNSWVLHIKGFNHTEMPFQGIPRVYKLYKEMYLMDLHLGGERINKLKKRPCCYSFMGENKKSIRFK